MRERLVDQLQRQYPRIYRVAAALTGSVEHAESVANAVVARAVKQRAKTITAIDADRWFLHHTVLTARELVRLNGWSTHERLPLPAELATLPVQQREAFLLHHGERLDLRQLATAMDCSTTAASNHLVAAASRLRSSIDDLEAVTATLAARLAAVVPPPADVVAKVDLQVRRSTRSRRLRRWVGMIVTAVAVGATAYFSVTLWRELIF